MEEYLMDFSDEPLEDQQIWFDPVDIHSFMDTNSFSIMYLGPLAIRYANSDHLSVLDRIQTTL